MKTATVLIMLFLCCNACPPIAFPAQQWGPWQVPTQKHDHSRRDRSQGLLGTTIGLFQKYISPIDGARCNMYPTCSAYARQAVNQYGPLLGTFIFVDRLYHEGDTVEHQRPIIKYGYIRYYDPLESNTFWWDKKQ